MHTPRVLILAPDGWGDPATDYWAPYEAIFFNKIAQEAGAETKVLRGQDDNKQNYDEEVKKSDMITGVGHGRDDAFAGFRNQILEQCPVPQGKYDNKGWFPVSCEVGQRLAPEIVEKSKNAASIGETTLYYFYANPTAIHKGEDPEKEDPYIASFIIPEVKFRVAILGGMRLADAYQVMLTAYEEEAKKWENKEPDVADTLRYDATFRKKFGNDDWRLPGTQPPPQPPQCDYTCAICGYKAKDATDLTNHVFNVHSKTVEKHNCPFCNYEAKNTDDLKQHILTVHLAPCKLRDWLRKSLGCPIEKLK
ncbi:MAG: hypothetical protein QW166_05515 [Candidatus Bathyarchaeia archaeon]